MRTICYRIYYALFPRKPRPMATDSSAEMLISINGNCPLFRSRAMEARRQRHIPKSLQGVQP